MKQKTIAILAALFFLGPLHAQETQELPVFIANLSNPNDFSLFANGGWDGNWYVGYNTCWVQKLPAPPQKNYERAFIGAKLGRMKNFQPQGKAPWEKRVVPADIYIAIASTPAWTRRQSFFLTASQDIPLEPDSQNAVEGVGESRWFWREIPLNLVNLNGDNYLALWSPTEALKSAESAPIIASGWGNKEIDSWLDNDIKGLPPSKLSKSSLTPLTVFEPAIALKLIPAQKEKKLPVVKIAKIEDGKPIEKYPAPKIVWTSIQGESIERAWVEVSTDAATWNRYGKTVWNSPFSFTIKTHEVPIGPKGETWIRINAADIFENVGASSAVNIFERR